MARILVIDDSRLSRTRMNDALTEAGHVVLEAVNGVQGLLAHSEHQPDCIFLDLLMPEMDGHEFLRQLRGGGSDTPVVVCTADIQDSSRAICEQLVISGFLNKPVKAHDLVASVKTALNQLVKAVK